MEEEIAVEMENLWKWIIMKFIKYKEINFLGYSWCHIEREMYV